jgi:hypothetical protein
MLQRQPPNSSGVEPPLREPASIADFAVFNCGRLAPIVTVAGFTVTGRAEAVPAVILASLTAPKPVQWAGIGPDGGLPCAEDPQKGSQEILSLVYTASRSKRGPASQEKSHE